MWCVMLTRIGLFILQQFLHIGCLRIVIANGPTHSLKGDSAGPEVTIHLQNYRLFWRILLKPDLAIGEAYMDGSLTIANDDLEQLMALLMANNGHWQKHWLARIGLFAGTYLAFWKFFNLPGRAKRNVAHHYDLKDSLFDQFLDPRRQYSCGYFHNASDTLADAQVTELARLGAKLCLQPNQQVLDIGCGWGGLANALWEMQPDISVTGITLSENQHVYATQKAKQDNRQQHLAFHLCDYRHQRGSFDRIVSVGMLEHVGMRHFDSYFASIARLLAPNGVALIHSIGVHHNTKRCNRWLNKYIFPGGYIPSLEQMTRAAGRQGLKILDMEIMRGHYAETLKQWRQAFRQNIATVRQDYDERFIRMWEFYLIGCEYFFRCQDGMVFQLQLAHDHNAAPLTRRYISQTEDQYRKKLCPKINSGKPSRLIS